MVKKETNKDIAVSLEKLEDIVRWLDEQERVDVQEGLAKVKEGVVLVRALKSRLKEVENEYQEVKRELESDDAA